MANRLGYGLGDSLGMSLDYPSIPEYLNIPFNINKDEIAVLRDLAVKIRELANRPVEAEKKELWYKHNALEETRPVIFCDPENGWYEIIPSESLKCVNPLARIWEFRLRKEIFWGEQLKDDHVVEDIFVVHYLFRYSDFGITHHEILPDDINGAMNWEPAIKDYSKDLPKLKTKEIIIEHETTRRLYNLALEVFGDVLRVQYRSAFWGSLGMTYDLIYLRGLENVMLDMYDNPDELHQVMSILRDDALNRLDFVEEHNLLTLNNRGSYVGSGGYGWLRALPGDDFDGIVRAKHMWGHFESQETTCVSPEMFAEFVFPYQKPVMERFAINCYGCCEPVHTRWDILKNAPNLRRVSVSAWTDVHYMAEALGKNYVFSWKPRPADLAVPKINREMISDYIKETVTATRKNNCRLEIIMKDMHTLANNPQNAIDWVQLARKISDQ